MKSSETFLLFVYVPESHAGAVRAAIGEAGAGRLGDYEHCSFSAKGTGRFRPTDKANPFIGNSGTLEEVTEEKIEVICSKECLELVLEVIRKAHPYEEVPMGVFPLL